jgi:hypothetical protein
MTNQQQKLLLQNCNPNQLLAPSVSSFSSEQSTHYQELNCKLPHNSDFDAKIRELEEQAKLFRIQENASRSSSKPTSPIRDG